MPDIDDLFYDPNGPAYVKREERVGPPLSYVAEKLRYAVEAAHEAHLMIQEMDEDVAALRPAYAAFQASVNAFLALQNMLGLMTPDTAGRLLQMTDDELEDWLDGVEREGVVSENS